MDTSSIEDPTLVRIRWGYNWPPGRVYGWGLHLLIRRDYSSLLLCTPWGALLWGSDAPDFNTYRRFSGTLLVWGKRPVLEVGEELWRRELDTRVFFEGARCLR